MSKKLHLRLFVAIFFIFCDNIFFLTARKKYCAKKTIPPLGNRSGKKNDKKIQKVSKIDQVKAFIWKKSTAILMPCS